MSFDDAVPPHPTSLRSIDLSQPKSDVSDFGHFEMSELG
jgi:hypothetical protein